MTVTILAELVATRNDINDDKLMALTANSEKQLA